MKLELTRIGNSRGIRIPKPIITQCGFGDVVDLRVTPEGLIIAAHGVAREGWKQAFAESNCEPEMLIEIPPNRFDREEWKW